MKMNIDKIKSSIADFVGIMKNEYHKGFTFFKIVRTLAVATILFLVLDLTISILSPNDGWLSLDSNSIFKLELETGYISAANKSYMLTIDPFDDSNISIDFLADAYQLYDKSGNIVQQAEERDALRLNLGSGEGITISSISNDLELIEYNLFTQSNATFCQERDTVFINDGYRENLRFAPFGDVTIQTRRDVLNNEWEIYFTNNEDYSAIHCKGYIFLRIHNCDSVSIIRDGTHTVSSSRNEYWYLSNITKCSASLVGDINFKVSSMSLDYRVANQPLFISGDDLTSILEIEENNIINFNLVGTANTVELNEDSLFPSVFNIIYSNLWGFLAILITPFVSFFLNIWYPPKKT